MPTINGLLNNSDYQGWIIAKGSKFNQILLQLEIADLLPGSGWKNLAR
jgi:hypothetical protein